MNIIFIGNRKGKTWTLTLNNWAKFLLSMCLLGLPVSGGIYLGMQLGESKVDDRLMDYMQQELAEQHPKALRPPKLLHVKTAVQEQRSSTPQAFLRRRGHRDVRRSKVDRARVEQQLPRAAVPASARLRRDVDTAEPAQRSSFAASRAAEVRAFTPVVPPRGRAAPSVLRLRGDERRVAVTRGFLRRRVAAKWGFLRRRCRLRRRGRPQPRWQETTVSRRRFERRAYRASVPPEVAAPAGPAVPAAARDQREHSSERGYRVSCYQKYT